MSNLRGPILGCLAVLGMTTAAFVRSPSVPPPASHSSPEVTPTEPEGVRGTEVTMDGVEFKPEALIARVGETVTWTNKDPYPHSVTSSSGAFKSGDIAPDAQWRFHATTAGRFPYTCTLHPGMNGTLIVEP